jgi:hypothetical protein
VAAEAHESPQLILMRLDYWQYIETHRMQVTDLKHWRPSGVRLVMDEIFTFETAGKVESVPLNAIRARLGCDILQNALKRQSFLHVVHLKVSECIAA